jgi:hypothetical protein
MSVTRTAVLIGIMCAAWMTSPLMANALEIHEFVGLKYNGSIRVKKCGVDAVRTEKSGTKRISDKTALNVELQIDFLGGVDGTPDGLGGDDKFDADFRFDEPITPLLSGAWTRIDERNGKVTYQLTPSGDLTEISTDPDGIRYLDPDSGVTGWEELLGYMNEKAGCACDLVCDGWYPTMIFPALSDFVKGTLEVYTNESGEIPCPASASASESESEVSCRKANVKLDVNAFMNVKDGKDRWSSTKTDSVRFKYMSRGYVVSIDPTPTPTPTATPTATPTPTPTAIP